MARVRVEPFGAEVECAAGETVLGAVLRGGYYLRYGCRHGGCGTCRALVVSGSVDDAGSTFALTDSARGEGWMLSCSSTPVGDCVIDVSCHELGEAEFYGGDQVGVMSALLESVESLTPSIYSVRMRLIDPVSLSFRAGQFVDVEVPEAAGARAFSLANSPAQDGVVELFVKRLPGGLFAGYLESARPGSVLRLRGPLGSLRVRPSYRKLVMIAGGSGLAPMLSMLTDLAERGDRRAAWLFFGARTTQELYHLDRIDELRRASADLEFVPVVDSFDESWSGETGLVTDAVARRLPSLRGFDAYLCGPPPMVAAAIDVVRRLGVREPNIYYDAFVPTGTAR
ncbi:MAG TPA: 2Fe-2S iron-sulfur cluster binding domain-containing protein [Streptosporangiaceae bacterium]|nr:2Fe-2S iron-sulfur cluster binding domain-containing protein [Streptosporangiaceae bacterium]